MTAMNAMAPTEQPLAGNRKTWVLVGLLFGMLLGALDQTIVGTAMPRVIASLGGMNLYAWVFTAYMLAATTSVPVFGKLSDLYGRKYFYIGSLVVFMLGSVLCGAAQTMTQLIVFRGLQGLGAGSMMANALAIIGDIFPPSERGRYQGIMGAVFGLSSVLGPALGGYLTDNLNWRWVFYVNLPVGIIAVVILALVMSGSKVTVKRPVDYLGAATLLLASVPMLLAFSWAGKDFPWSSLRIIGLLAFSAVFWVAFVLVERKAQEPILPMDLFNNSIFSVSSLAVFLTGAGMFGAIMFVPLFMQAVIGISATNSGMLLTPLMLSVVASSVLGGQVISRTGRYKWITVAAVALMAFGMYMMSLMTETTTQAEVVRNMIIVGLGLGVTMPVFTIAVQNAVPHDRLGIVTAAVQFFRSIGGTIGVAVFGTFLTSSMQREIDSLIPEQVRQAVPADKLKTMVDPQALMNPDSLAHIKAEAPAFFIPILDKILSGVRHALVIALHDVFLVGFAAIVVAFLVLLLLKEIPLRRSHQAPAAIALEGAAE